MDDAPGGAVPDPPDVHVVARTYCCFQLARCYDEPLAIQAWRSSAVEFAIGEL